MNRILARVFMKPGPTIVGALVLLTGCGQKREARPDTGQSLPVVSVRTRNVESRKWPSTEEVVGTVRAQVRATVEARVTGRIRQMPVVLGQRVNKGQLLARVDAAEIEARLEQAQASFQQAERDWRRTGSLFEQQAVTRTELEAAETHRLLAKGAVAEARAIMAQTEVMAPFDGVVTKKWADVGDLAAPGKPLVDVEDSVFQLEADVPEASASRIQPGASMAIRGDVRSNELSGTVAEIGPAADPSSRTFRVKLDLPKNSGLMSGQFARLLVPRGESASLGVPASAVVRRGQMELVFAVEDQHARLHLVKTGRQMGDEIEILSGLDPGDSIVVEGASQLSDGQPVK